MSVSKPKTTTSQASVVNTTNIGVEDVSGISIIGDGNRVTSTDYGAIDAAGNFANAALDVGLEALRMGSDNLDRSLSFAGRATDAIVDVNRGAFDFGSSVVSDALSSQRDAVREISQFGGVAIGEVAGANREALNAVLDAGSGVLDFARDIFSSSAQGQANLAQQNLTGLTALAKQTSESGDDRVTRVAMYAFLAVAAVFIIPKLAEKFG